MSSLIQLQDTDIAEIIQSEFISTLCREASDIDIEHHLNLVKNGIPLARIIDGIRSSEEAALKSVLSDNSEAARVANWENYVSRIYRALLSRSPSEDEIKSWAGLAQSTDPHTAFYNIIADSEEAKANLARSNFGQVPSTNLNAIAEAIIALYKTFFNRRPADKEVSIWVQHVKDGAGFPDIIHGLATSEEARQANQRSKILPQIVDGKFIQAAYLIVLGRAATPIEIAHWEAQLRLGNLPRSVMLQALFEAAYGERFNATYTQSPDMTSILGTTKTVSKLDWDKQSVSLAVVDAPPVKPNANNINVKTKTTPIVSVIVSMYNGEKYIREFMTNMKQQTIFHDCEIVIIDANSPQNEREIIADDLKNYPNIKYIRDPNRIGIYEAWNIAIQASTAPYITNANLDDLRREDSFELQAATLNSIKFADVVYQDFYYSFDCTLPFEIIANHNIRSSLPIITNNNMLAYNSPHNAPMWRRSMHADVGLFDASFKSAGDYEFWLRCIKHGKKFYKINDPHVVYYVNPQGLSTNAETVGVLEARQIQMKYAETLISPLLTCDIESYLRECRLFEADEGAKTLSRYELAQASLLHLA